MYTYFNGKLSFYINDISNTSSIISNNNCNNNTSLQIKTTIFHATDKGIFYVSYNNMANNLLYYLSFKNLTPILVKVFKYKILCIFCSEYLFIGFDGVIEKYIVGDVINNDIVNKVNKKDLLSSSSTHITNSADNELSRFITPTGVAIQSDETPESIPPDLLITNEDKGMTLALNSDDKLSATLSQTSLLETFSPVLSTTKVADKPGYVADDITSFSNETNTSAITLIDTIPYTNTVTHLFTNDIYLYIISPYLTLSSYKLDILPPNTSYDKIDPIYGKSYGTAHFLLTYNVMVYILTNRNLEFLTNIEEILKIKTQIRKLDLINNLLIVLVDTITDESINKDIKNKDDRDSSSDNIIGTGRRKIKILKPSQTNNINKEKVINNKNNKIHLIDLYTNKCFKTYLYNNYIIVKENYKYFLFIENKNSLIKENISDFVRIQPFVHSNNSKKYIINKISSNDNKTGNKITQISKKNTNTIKSLKKLFETDNENQDSNYNSDSNSKYKKKDKLLNKKVLELTKQKNNENKISNYRYLKYKLDGGYIILKRILNEYSSYTDRLYNLVISHNNKNIVIIVEIPINNNFEILSADFDSDLNICVLLFENCVLNILNLKYLNNIKNMMKVKKVILGINKSGVLKVLKLICVKNLVVDECRVDNRVDIISCDVNYKREIGESLTRNPSSNVKKSFTSVAQPISEKSGSGDLYTISTASCSLSANANKSLSPNGLYISTDADGEVSTTRPTSSPQLISNTHGADSNWNAFETDSEEINNTKSKLIISTDCYVYIFDNLNLKSIFSLNKNTDELKLIPKIINLPNIIQQKVTNSHYFFITRDLFICKLNVLFNNEVFIGENISGDFVDFFASPVSQSHYNNDTMLPEKNPWFLNTKIYLIIKAENKLILKELIKCSDEQKRKFLLNKNNNIMEMAQFISSIPVYNNIMELPKDFVSVYYLDNFNSEYNNNKNTGTGSVFGYISGTLKESMTLKRVSINEKKENKLKSGEKGVAYNPFR